MRGVVWMLRRAIAVLFFIALSRTAVAEEGARRKSGIFLAGSAAWSVPTGKVGDINNSGHSPDLSNRIDGLFPFVLEMGYRVIPHLSVSATFQYAFALLDRCSDCSGHDLSAGANVAWHFTPLGAHSGWAAVGLGYERLSIRNHSAAMRGLPGVDLQSSLSGIQFLNLRVGVDIAASPRIWMGPFVGASLGRYSSASGNVTVGDRSQSVSGDIEDPDVHTWLSLGMLCRFDL